MNFKRLIQGFFLSLVFLFVFGFFWWGMQRFSEQNKFLGSASDSVKDLNKIETPYKNPDAAELEVGAESAISLYSDSENHNKILFAKNEEEKMPIASLTKLMTATVVFENFDLAENVQISKDAERQDTRGLLKAGESFVAKDLLYDMLIESNNSAAYAFFEAMGQDKFIKLMNLKANEIGLKNTYFSSSTGLGLTNYSTAKDLADFAKYILNNDNLIITITSIPEFDLYDSNGIFHHKAYNLNDLLKDSELKDRIIAGKTGQTKDAGESLLLILKAPENKGYLINVVLNAKGRFGEMKRIINWEDNAYIWK